MPKVALALTPRVAVKAKPVLVTSPKLNALLEERLIVGAKFSQLEAKKRALDDEIKLEVAKRSKREDGAVETADYIATNVKSSNSSVSREALLKAGVKATIVEKCTKVVHYVYARIDKKKIVEPDSVLSL